MKIQFKQQQYQVDATDALVRVFAGQTKGERREILDRKTVDTGLFGTETIVEELFSNKKLEINEAQILKNLQEIQKEQNIPLSKKLEEGKNFTVEMETGTGKTYVYTRTMFEMNKQYGWNKFIIMVPSVAIREGVYKSLQLTADHFFELYGKKIRFHIYDTKNKSNIANIKSFGDSSDIQVFVMNYQAFATKTKDSKKIYEPIDATGTIPPIEIIKRTRPILIIDEPQRFGDVAEKSLLEFDPLFIVRFSATHKKEYNKVYRLDAVDAFNQKLVKKIRVKGIEVHDTTGTNSYIFVDRINIKSHCDPTVTLEFEQKQGTGVKKIFRNLCEKDNLFELSGELRQYDGYIIKTIDGRDNTVTFLNGETLRVGQATKSASQEVVRRIQIRETIKSHIEKERELFKKGIKVLSLFFIDEVAKYRAYDSAGNQIQSEYEKMFEEEYQNIISERTLFDDEYYAYLEKHDVKKIHNGYFSIDKKGKAIDSKEGRSREGSDDVSAYDLIMKDKERLLSFDEPTRFIFSHSALREGWDNPNIFQICTLKQSDSAVSKRQEIGRGLRVCVNAQGERMDYDTLGEEFFDCNSLTVVASESYDSFSKELQKEIADSLTSRPKKLEASVLKGFQLKNKNGEKFTFDEGTAMDVIFALREKGYVDKEYKITESFMEDVNNKSVEFPEEIAGFEEHFTDVLVGIYTTSTFNPIENEKADNLPKTMQPNENFAKKEFQELWKALKVKTFYKVDFDSNELIEKSITALDRELNVSRISVRIVGGEQSEELTEKKLKSNEVFTKTKTQIEETISILGDVKYDLVHEIALPTNLTRKTVVEILKGINQDTFYKFKLNPEQFIKESVRIINEQKAATLINNVTYDKTKEEYSDEIFTINNIKGSSKENLQELSKHIYDYIITDSDTEKTFAKSLQAAEEVSIFAKLPSGFKIPTPVGNYNPDWAIVFDSKDVKYVYFIAETKGSMSSMQIRASEKFKIQYAKKHFESLSLDNVKYDTVATYEDLREKIFK